MRTHRLLPVAALGLALFAGVGTAHAATVKHTWRVNLDGDRHKEKVELVQTGTGAGVTIRRWLVIIDRRQGQTITKRITPRLWYLSRSDVKIADLNAKPRRKEIFYVGYIGGTAGSPTYAAIKGWNGRRVHTFFSFKPPYKKRHHNGHTYSYDGVQITVKQIASGGEPADEISLHEAEITGSAPLCCPQYDYDRLYRYNTGSRSWVVYEHRWKRNV
jgi:hypothetical protein